MCVCVKMRLPLIYPEEQNKLQEGISEYLQELTMTLLRVNQQDKVMHMHTVITLFFVVHTRRSNHWRDGTIVSISLFNVVFVLIPGHQSRNKFIGWTTKILKCNISGKRSPTIIPQNMQLNGKVDVKDQRSEIYTYPKRVVEWPSSWEACLYGQTL